MAKILSVGKIKNLSKELDKQNKRIVLVGGCFDILHPGHLIFLEKAKKEGDCLFVLLESDERIQELKGTGRPVHSQEKRAKALADLDYTDYIVMLPDMKLDKDYDELICKIKPDVIAVTAGQGSIHHQRVAKLVGAQLKAVTNMIGDYSTSKMLNT